MRMMFQAPQTEPRLSVGLYLRARVFAVQRHEPGATQPYRLSEGVEISCLLCRGVSIGEAALIVFFGNNVRRACRESRADFVLFFVGLQELDPSLLSRMQV